jgi:D-beta-D-heptose 7-phosphate kinase/D-beta-D-heptose 1-phosphate adenosyltransferase
MSSLSNRIVPRREVAALGESLRAEGRRIVFTNGCFDLLHVGHARYLVAARELGDALVVGVNSDASVRALKGPARPLVPEGERAELLAALRAVDYVTLFPEPTPEAVIELLRPDIHVKGGDYRLEDLPEAESVRRAGGRVVLLPFTAGRSTTALVERIREATRT